jgi:hypothetical protein
VPSAAWPEQSASLPGRRSLRVAQALLAALDHELQEGVGRLGLGGEPVVERVAQSGLDQALGVGGRQPLLGLALELRIADEDRDQRAGLGQDVVGGDQAGALLAHQLAIGLQAPRQGGAQARLVGAALGSGHSVAVGLHEAVGFAEARRRPGDRPLHRPCLALALIAAGKGLGGDGLQALDPLAQEVRQAVREPEGGLGRGLVVDAGRIAGPADLDPAEQIGLGAGHPVEAGWLEGAALAEDQLVGDEADGRAVLAAGAELLDPAQRLAAGKDLPPLEAVLEGRDLQALGEGVDH